VWHYDYNPIFDSGHNSYFDANYNQYQTNTGKVNPAWWEYPLSFNLFSWGVIFNLNSDKGQ